MFETQVFCDVSDIKGFEKTPKHHQPQKAPDHTDAVATRLREWMTLLDAKYDSICR